MTFTRKLLHVGATALMLSTVATVTTFVTADTAYAERGANGNGNGNGNARGRDRENQSSNRGQARQQERAQLIESAGVRNWGAIASELANLNKANANLNARLNSSDPIHQALGVYELSDGITADGVRAYNTASEAYNDLLGKTVFVDADGNVVEEDTGVTVDIDSNNVVQYYGTFQEYSGLSQGLIDAYAALSVLNGYRDTALTPGAVDALNYMLDLDDPYSM